MKRTILNEVLIKANLLDYHVLSWVNRTGGELNSDTCVLGILQQEEQKMPQF